MNQKINIYINQKYINQKSRNIATTTQGNVVAFEFKVKCKFVEISVMLHNKDFY